MAGALTTRTATKNCRHTCCKGINMRTLKSITVTAILLAPLLLAACNTVNGAGKDVSGAGQDLSGAAKTVQQKL